MTLEPSHCHTVAIRPCLPPKTTRTLADYQAPIIARYGKMPSWPELAKQENIARYHRRETSTATISPQGIESLRSARLKSAEATDTQVLSAISETGSTTQDVASVTGRAENVARHALLRLHSAGRVTCAKFKRVSIWKRTNG